MSKPMNSEQMLLDKWRDLTSERQQEVLDFLDFIWQKSVAARLAQPLESKKTAERVKRWIDWAESHPENSPGLSDEALRRDSIYD
jgi:hypothetical protein